VIQRALSTFSLWAIVLLVVIFGGADGSFVLLLLVSALTQWEFYRLGSKVAKSPPFAWLGIVLGTAFLCLAYIMGPHWLTMSAYAVSGFMLWLLDAQRSGISIWQFPTLKGYLLIPGLVVFFPLLLQAHGSLMHVLWMIAVVKFTDAGALVFGKAFGRHKLALRISPGKTIEGAIGGVLTGIVVGVCLTYLDSISGLGLTPLKAAFVAALLGPVSIISDLMGSWLKRRAGVKDSGNLIPGIGGFLDLMDSLLLCAPVTYFCFELLLVR
jgi:phosphatidate cytidylyltransferase